MVYEGGLDLEFGIALFALPPIIGSVAIGLDCTASRSVLAYWFCGLGKLYALDDMYAGMRRYS